jgi:hypothetical protein
MALVMEVHGCVSLENLQADQEVHPIFESQVLGLSLVNFSYFFCEYL